MKDDPLTDPHDQKWNFSEGQPDPSPWLQSSRIFLSDANAEYDFEEVEEYLTETPTTWEFYLLRSGNRDTKFGLGLLVYVLPPWHCYGLPKSKHPHIHNHTSLTHSSGAENWWLYHYANGSKPEEDLKTPDGKASGPLAAHLRWFFILRTYFTSSDVCAIRKCGSGG